MYAHHRSTEDSLNVPAVTMLRQVSLCTGRTNTRVQRPVLAGRAQACSTRSRGSLFRINKTFDIHERVSVPPEPATTPADASYKTGDNKSADLAAKPVAEHTLNFSNLGQLNSVFQFKHLPSPRDQGKPLWLLDRVEAFVQGLGRHPLQALWPDLTPDRVCHLQSIVQYIKDPGPGLHIEWLPEFGCALLPLVAPSDAVLQPGHVALYLVAPDAWTFNMHSFLGGADHTSTVQGTTWLFNGSVPAQQYSMLVGKMHSIIREQREGKQKEKQKGISRANRSHYKCTPAFIFSVAEAALKAVTAGAEQADGFAGSCAGGLTGTASLTPPRGGFTDVGLHTGSKPKATAWPVLQSTIKAVMFLQAPPVDTARPPGSSPVPAPELAQLYAQAMLQFELWLLWELLPKLGPSTAVPDAVTAVMTMLQSVSSKAAGLSVQGLNMDYVETAVVKAVQHVEKAVADRQLQAAAELALPLDATAAAGTWRLPTGTLPGELPAAAQQQGLDAALARAASNLGSVGFVKPGQPLPELLHKSLHLLTQYSSAADCAVLHALHTTERTLFAVAAAAFVQPALSADGVAVLAEVVDSYRVALKAFRASLRAERLAMLQTELRSKEALVGWVAYCLIHQAASSAHPLARQCGVALDWEDLKHLSLGDRFATDAALGIATYLRSHTKPGQELFHLSKQAPTLSFAEAYAAGDSNMCSMLAAHRAAGAACTAEHWRQVQKKQREAAQLRSDIAVLESRRSSLDTDRYYAARRSSEWYTLEAKIAEVESQLSSKESALRTAETPPPPVMQPLPKSHTLARQWVFFMHMPFSLRYLARSSCLAQQLLLPNPVSATIWQQVQVTTLRTSLPSHYNACQADHTYHTPPKEYKGSDGGSGFVLAMSSGTVPSKVGPDHIDSFYSQEDGVWYPDSLALTMGWQGSNCSADAVSSSFFNPFAVTDTKTVIESFTAQLPRSYSQLQWAMYQYGSLEATASDRGNKGLASQDLMPDGMRKSEYAAFTALRSFPMHKVHRLCEALRDKELPLEDAAVQLLVQQTVHHLGELKASSTSNGGITVRQLWRTDWDVPGGVLETLCFELHYFADELSNKPRDQGSVLLLGQLAAYLSDWHAPCKPVARQFAAMTSSYADTQLQAQIDVLVAQGPDEAQLAELKAKQTKWRAMALLCFTAGPLSTADVGVMLRLMLLIKHGDVYQPDKVTAAELAALRVLCHDVMARRLPELIAQLDSHPELLTDAAAGILECLQQQPGGPSPPKLPWERLHSSSSAPVASYQAVGSDGHLYSINVLDGTLLFDGNPPGRLPNSILQHSLYLRTFGSTNHEVKTTADGQLETIRPIEGRFYRFKLVPASSSTAGGPGQLVITELDPTQLRRGRLELQLLDPGAEDACAGWGDELPVRLRKMYSHWYCREHGVMVLRDKAVHQHAVHFVICCNLVTSSGGGSSSSDSAAAVYSCWQVPQHLQQQHWTAVLTRHAAQLSERQLVLPDNQTSQVLRVLGRFETADFMHCYMRGYCPGLQTPKPKFWFEHSGARNSAGVLLASGSASAGMVWQLPRCNLQFELSAAGSVVSLDHRGYSLSTQQLLVSGPGKDVSYTLPEFHQYLVLQAQQGSGSDAIGADRSEKLVLVASGRVSMQCLAPGSEQRDPSISVQLSAECSAAVKVFKYALHGRFGYLTSPCTTSRLQLAALYAASSSLLPEPGSKLTGAARAMQLMRHSWTNEPLSAGQQQHLQDISRLGGFQAPALRLLCHDLAVSAGQLQHLYVAEVGAGAAARRAGDSSEPAAGHNSSIVGACAAGTAQQGSIDADAASEYLLHARAPVPAGFPANPRLQLTEHEEGWSMHTGPLHLSTAAHSIPDWKRFGRYREISTLPQFPVAEGYVQQAEAFLMGLVQPAQQHQPQPFPLPQVDSTVPAAHKMMSELQASWDCHQQHPEPTTVKPGALSSLASASPYTLAEVTRLRTAAEAYLLHHLSHVPDSVGPAGHSFRLLVASGQQPTPSPVDLMSMAWGPAAQLLAFNPFLSADACKQLRAGVLTWLELCVLEDRLERVMKLAAAGEEYRPRLIKELLTHRTWDVSRHPQWLVFEVEGRLQIRPNQHALANILLSGGGLDGLGPIAQLNMGEGKTRVILPMMILELANGDNLVRVNFLSQLLHEGMSHLQQHLTASVLGRKVFSMPFHRGINVTGQTLGVMAAALAYCQKVGGVLLMAPEHRNSLYLKYVELAQAAGTDEGGAELALQTWQLQEGFPYYDILDESDEVLHHHRRQLVYAWGESMSLPALEPRMEVVQALLLVVSKLVDAGDPLLNMHGLVLKSVNPADRKPGSFCGLQLLSGEQLDASFTDILELLAKALIEDAPLQDELGWLKNFPDKAFLCQLLTDRGASAAATISKALPDDKRDQVLAARELLTCGLLLHCLQSRHRVHHGINRSASAKKRLSVPYRAADLPSPRSEFSQPEVALTYTHLAYYGDGLSPREFKAAVLTLLSRGPSEQAYHYGRWLAQGAGCGKQVAGETSAFDSVDKVDPHNSQLMRAMWDYFSHNMEVVNYWLATCVLPAETKQYPSRLVATAWHLAQNPTGNIAGFSGTKDNHRLLPMQVQQVSLDSAPELQGTDGKMLDILLRDAQYATLDAKAGTTVWQALLQHALERQVDAIIDCGALLAGVDLRAAAQYILTHAPAGRYRGVTFFCRTAGCWVILDTAGRLNPKGSSHLRECETLAMFDDARCRGADLVLRQNAVGLLTLAPGVPKDKLMQAAGRLRQLGRGQTLLVVGLPDVSSKIAGAAPAAAAEGAKAQTASAALVAAAAAAAGGQGSSLEGRVTRSSASLHLPQPSPKKQKGSGLFSKMVKHLDASKQQSAQAEPDMQAVMTWVMANTVQATLSGISEAASQGMQFAATYGGPLESCVLPERLEVGDLYGSSRVVEAVPALLAGVAGQYSAHARKHFTSSTAGGPSCLPAMTGTQSGAIDAVRGSGDSGSAQDSMAVDAQVQLSGSLSSMSLDHGLAEGSAGALSSSSSSSRSAASLANSSSDDVSMDGSDASAAAADAGAIAAAGAIPADGDVSLVLSDIHAVQERFSVLGVGHAVIAGSGADEECERELEQEEEEEQEAEVQLPAATAAAERDWEWGSAFTAARPAQLRGCTVLSLRQVLQVVGSAGGVGEIAWSDNVYATYNFVHSIAASGSVSPGLSDYLRPVGAVLLFPGSGELLLLSEREADALQRELWQSPTSRAPSKPNVLLSLPYLRLAVSNTGNRYGGPSAAGHSTAQQRLLLATSLSHRPANSGSADAHNLQHVLTTEALVSVQLFAGCVMYGSQGQRELLHRLLSGRREAAQELVGWRGKLHTLSRSDLDRACADDSIG